MLEESAVMASELPIVTRIGTPTTTSSNGTSRNAPPAPTSPAPTPTLPHTVAVSGRLKRRGSPMGRDGARSEERRVGKECRSRWAPDHEQKKKRKMSEVPYSEM